MSKTKLRIVSALTALALVGSTAGVASLVAPFASAATGGPTVTLTTSVGSSTSMTSVPVTATFSEDVTGFDASDITLGGSASGSVSGFASTSDSVYTFNVDLSTGGSVTVQVPEDMAMSVASSTGNQASNILGFDALGPAISNVMVSGIGSTTATVSWNTDQTGTGQVNFGTTNSYGSSVGTTGSASTTQSVTLTGLSPGTLYHFAVEASNGVASTTSSDQTFTTLSSATTSLAVTGIDAISTTATADNTYANGWKWIMHLTVPDTENAFRIKFSDWAQSSTTSFGTANNMRVFSSQSSNANSEGTAITETSTGYSDWLYLTGDTSTSTPGRQVDLTIEVKIPVGTANGSYTTNFTAQSFPSAATSTATSTP